MVQHTKHPVAPPPAPPEREATGRLLLRAYVIVLFIAVFAHAAVYNLVGQSGAAVVLAVLAVTTVAIAVPLVVRGLPHPVLWRRLPWAAVAYVTLAALSVLWSRWPAATLLTGALLVSITLGALFIAHALSWTEIVRALGSAFKWIVALSLAIELWAAAILRGPILPNFLRAPEGRLDPHAYWVRGNLFDGGRLQGIVGNANLLAMISLLALISFGVLFATRARWRTTLVLWMLLAAFLLVRAASATAFAGAAVAAAVLVVALLIRRTRTARARVRIYLWCSAVVAVGGVAAWALQDRLLSLLGRSSDLTGRGEIWQRVLERAAERPVFGNGFSSPWIPTEPAIDGWIVDHGMTVFHAHNMWIDVFFQLGGVGVALMALAYLSLLWRAWFFAADRPRWDMRADRPYSPLTLLPILFTTVILVQGLTESTPIMLWGWLLLVMLSFKIKSVPLVGVGLSERSRITERGRQPRRVP